MLSGLSLASSDALAQGATPTPEPDDPLLAPVSAPTRRIAAWSEVATTLRARSVDLAASLATVRRAEAESRVALAALYGRVGAQLQGTQNLITKDTTAVVGASPTGPITETITNPTPRIGTAQASLLVPVFAPQTWQQVKTAQLGVDLATELLADRRRVLVEKVAGAIVAVVASERVAEINRVGLRGALDRGALARKRQALGGGTSIDVVRADKDVESARALVVSGDESLRQARESLGLALGWAEQVGVAPTFQLDDAVRDALRECRPAQDIAQRADVVAAQQRIGLAEQVGKEARASLYPTFGVQSQFSYTTQDVSLVYPTQWNIAGVLAWNLWDGGARYAQIRSGAAQRDVADANLEGTRRDVVIAVKRAERAIEVAEASRVIAQRTRVAAAEQERLIRIGFTTGNATSLELVTAASELRNAEIQLALREYDVVRARLLALLVRARCDF